MFGNNLLLMVRKGISLVLIFSLAFGPGLSHAQSAFVSMLPEPGKMVGTSEGFTPILVKGLVVHPDKPFNFDFIVDSGNYVGVETQNFASLRHETERIVKYFLAALTVPEDSLWVNLSPYEKDRIIADGLGQTLLGRDMLAQDYVLKQLAATVLYPEKGLGKDFWARIYSEARSKFGTSDIPVDTFNKVWIMPETAEVFEKGHAVYVTRARLKVMLDSDYIAMSNNATPTRGHGAEGTVSTSTLPSEAGLDAQATQGANRMPDGHEMQGQDLAKQLIREIILPAIEKEVNEGKNFATLRQVYHAAILAKWYRTLVQDTLMSKAYVGKNKIRGVNTDEKTLKEEIYQRYIAAYKKGVFNYIKEENDPASGAVVPRQYFSGGLADFAMKDVSLTRTTDASMLGVIGKLFRSSFLVKSSGATDAERLSDAAMSIADISKLEGLKVKDALVIRELAGLMRTSPDPELKEAAGRKIIEEVLGNEYEALRLEAFQVILPLILPKITLPRPSEGEVDLHTHTYLSDAYDTPTAHILNAFEQGLMGVAVTDHNDLPVKESSRAINILNKGIAAFNAAAKRPVPAMNLVPGSEIATFIDGTEVHVLLYMPKFYQSFTAMKREQTQGFLDKLRQVRELTGGRAERIRLWINEHHPEFYLSAEEVKDIFRNNPYSSGTGDALWKKYSATREGREALARYNIKSAKDVWYNFIKPYINVSRLTVEEQGVFPTLDELMDFANAMNATIGIAHPNEIMQEKDGVFAVLLQKLSLAVAGGALDAGRFMGVEYYSYKLFRSPYLERVKQLVERLNADDPVYQAYPLRFFAGSDSHGLASWPSNPLGRFALNAIYPSDVGVYSRDILQALSVSDKSDAAMADIKAENPSSFAITGATGAVGTQLLRQLLARRDTKAVYVLARKEDGRVEDDVLLRQKLLLDDPRVHVIQGDLLNKDRLEDLVSKSDVIYHLAGWAGLEKASAEKAALANVVPTVLLSRLAQEQNKRLVLASTVHFYNLGSQRNGFISEEGLSLAPDLQDKIERMLAYAERSADNILHGEPALQTGLGDIYGNDLYAFTKLAAEQAVLKASKGVALRMANVYGPGDETVRQVPKFIREMSAGAESVTYIPGRINSFIYVKDLVKAFAAAGRVAVGARERVINVASPEQVSQKELFERIKGVTGAATVIAGMSEERFRELKLANPPALMFDTSRMSRVLGINTTTDIQTGLQETKDWILAAPEQKWAEYPIDAAQADELAREMEAAEQRQDYEAYNKASDALYALGDVRGNKIFVYDTAAIYTPNVYKGGSYDSGRWDAGYVKIDRQDFAMTSLAALSVDRAKNYAALLAQVEAEKDILESWETFYGRLKSQFDIASLLRNNPSLQAFQQAHARLKDVQAVDVFMNQDFSGLLFDRDGDAYLITTPSSAERSWRGQKFMIYVQTKHTYSDRVYQGDDYTVVGAIGGALLGGVPGGIMGAVAGWMASDDDVLVRRRVSRTKVTAKWVGREEFQRTFAKKHIVSYMTRQDIEALANTADAAQADGVHVILSLEKVAQWYQGLSTLEAMALWGGVGVTAGIVGMGVYSRKYIKLFVLENLPGKLGLDGAIRMLQDADSDVRAKAMQVVEILASESDAQYKAGVVGGSNYDVDVRRWAVGMLAKAGKVSIVELLYVLFDGVGNVREAARLALDKLASDADAQYQIGSVGLKNNDGDVRAWAIEMVEKSGKATVDYWLDTLKSYNEDVVIAARGKLEDLAINTEIQLKIGKAALSLPSSDTQVWVLGVLGRTGNKDLITLVEMKLSDMDNGVRVAARNALEMIGMEHGSLARAVKAGEQKIEDQRKRDELAKKMEDAGRRENYDMYNRLSDELYVLGDPRGLFHYVFGEEPYIISIDYNDPNFGMTGVNMPNIEWGTRTTWIKQDRAQVTSMENQNEFQRGGIDINNINVQKKSAGPRIQFNDAALKAVLENGFEGFKPVLINIVPVDNPLTVLGV